MLESVFGKYQAANVVKRAGGAVNFNALEKSSSGHDSVI